MGDYAIDTPKKAPAITRDLYDHHPQNPVAPFQYLPIQAKLPIGAKNDPQEGEADGITDKVMRMPQPAFVQCKCDSCKEEEGQVQRKQLSPFIQRRETNQAQVAPDVHEKIAASRGSGAAMDVSTRSFMESRFGSDFCDVRIHSDDSAAHLSRNLNAQAFTVGKDIYFNEGRYNPQSDDGKHLLAHELTHTIQQGNLRLLVQRFSDNDHHVIDESALSGVFDKDSVHNIERGNKQRDYSQSPKPANLLLLNEFDNFGGYQDYEHFDNFAWDRKNERWISRTEWEKKWDEKKKQWVPNPGHTRGEKGSRKKTPIEYIESELTAAIKQVPPSAEQFVRMGNAFHTIEDFFAHTNFLELTQNDYSFGNELISGSVKTPDIPSLYSVVSHITTGLAHDFFAKGFEREQALSPTTSHPKIAKDYASNKYHNVAMQLAAIVIQETAGSLKAIFSIKDDAKRQSMLQQGVLKQLKSYFRPPSPDNKWWERMLSEQGKSMMDRIIANRSKTRVTENQSSSSPLRALEANQLGDVRAGGNLSMYVYLIRFLYKAKGLNLLDMHIDDLPLPSVSVPLGKNAWLTAGRLFDFHGLGSINNQSSDNSSRTRLLPDAPRLHDDKDITSFAGVSIEGRF